MLLNKNGPVYPSGMEIMIHYVCPHCHKTVRVPPTPREVSVTCPFCKGRFALVPVDDSSIKFIQVMTLNGLAAIPQDYL